MTYKPWVGNTEEKPWIYSGSDYYDNPDYLGSASSKNIYDWSEGLTVGKWWKFNTKNYPENFEKKILIQCSSAVTRRELQSLEAAIQKAEDHRNNLIYFNRTNKHFNSPIIENPLKGMSYEEIYGEEKAIEIKEKRSKSQSKTRKNKLWNSNKNGKLTGLFKNKTYEEMHGEEKAKDLRKAKSEFMKNRIVSEETRKKSSLTMKNRPPIYCEFCKKHFDKLNYKRWHGIKCKENKNENI
jgi:hypothetical protein